MRHLNRWMLAVAATLLLGMAAPSARAELHAGTGEFEIYAGWFWPDDEGESNFDDFTAGLRLGYNVTEHFGIVGSLGYWEADDMFVFSVSPPVSGVFEQEALFADLSLEWHVNPEDAAVFTLYGGPGMVWYDTSFRDTADAKNDFDFDDESFSLHVGITTRISAGDRFFVRPDVRIRWFDDENPFSLDDEDITWEASIGLGWYIGAP